jgi:hypothetical protein
MRLDPTTGAIEVRPDLVITLATKPEDMQRAGAEHEGYSNGWSWERLKEGPWWVSVSFSPEHELYLVSLELDDGLPGGWEHWSEERALRQRDSHDEWLDEQLGPGWATESYDGASKGRSGLTSWGLVGSDYDTRSGGSSITIRYPPLDPPTSFSRQ